MKTRIWKSAGTFFYCSQAFEAHYRADRRELCVECEANVCFVAQEQALPRLGRQAVASLMSIQVLCRAGAVPMEDTVEFTIAPAGELVLIEPDHPAYVAEGFLVNAAHGARWLSRIH